MNKTQKLYLQNEKSPIIQWSRCDFSSHHVQSNIKRDLSDGKKMAVKQLALKRKGFHHPNLNSNWIVISENEIVVDLIDNTQQSLPSKLAHISRAIEKSKYILDLDEDWNDDEAAIIPQEIWLYTVKFLINYSLYLFRKDIKISAPEINPCKDGSIDLAWRTINARLLINIRYSADVPFAFYYGDLYNNTTPTKGNVPVEGVQEHLAVWMKALR